MKQVAKGHASRVTLSASKAKGNGQVVLATLSETDPSQLRWRIWSRD